MIFLRYTRSSAPRGLYIRTHARALTVGNRGTTTHSDTVCSIIIRTLEHNTVVCCITMSEEKTVDTPP